MSKSVLNSGLVLLVCTIMMVGNIRLSVGQTDDMQTVEIDVNGVTRRYALFMPSNVDDERLLPLVLAFHPAGGDGLSFAFRTGLNELAERDGVMIAYPEGPQGYWDFGVGLAEWEAVMGPLNEDVDFVAVLLDALIEQYPIDEAQIYAVGHSNGARMVHRVGCEFADRLAGIAAVAGTISTEVTAACPENVALSVLYMHGTEDETIPWAGKELRDDSGTTVISYALSAPDTINFWALRNGCDTLEPAIEEMEDANPDDNIGLRQVTFSGCEHDVDVVFYAILGGGHGWLGANLNLTPSDYQPSGYATEYVWAFFGFGSHE